jgi:hypothetical protein
MPLPTVDQPGDHLVVVAVLALVDHEPSHALSPGVGRLKHPQRGRGRLHSSAREVERGVRVEDPAVTTDQPSGRVLVVDRRRHKVLDGVRQLKRIGTPVEGSEVATPLDGWEQRVGGPRVLQPFDLVEGLAEHVRELGLGRPKARRSRVWVVVRHPMIIARITDRFRSRARYEATGFSASATEGGDHPPPRAARTLRAFSSAATRAWVGWARDARASATARSSSGVSWQGRPSTLPFALALAAHSRTRARGSSARTPRRSRASARTSSRPASRVEVELRDGEVAVLLAGVAHDAHQVEHCPGEAVDAGADQAVGVAVGEPVQRCDQGG